MGTLPGVSFPGSPSSHFSHSIPLASMTGTSSWCCAWGPHRHHSPEVQSASKKRKRKRSTQLLSHFLQTAEHLMILSFQKVPSDPPRSLSTVPRHGFSASRTLRVSVYVCLVARGKSKGRPKAPLQPQHGQKRSTSKIKGNYCKQAAPSPECISDLCLTFVSPPLPLCPTVLGDHQAEELLSWKMAEDGETSCVKNSEQR